jgi:hypothetical protein
MIEFLFLFIKAETIFINFLFSLPKNTLEVKTLPLFLAISIGLGYGAGQIIPTSMICIIIFFIIWFFIGNISTKKIKIKGVIT